MKNVILLLFPFASYAQVAKPVVVEHFTNSRCGVCAGQNPPFYQTLAIHPEVKHIAYHPTSPYANCQFAQHNPTESDARTNYYGLYGSTPKIAIQGSPVSNSPNPFSNPNLYDSYQGQTSSFSLKVIQTKETDTIRIRIILKTEAAHAFTSLHLYAAVAEDTVFYNSPNGESLHHDVFRKSFFGANGLTITPSPTVGDSVVFESKLGKNPVWNFSRIFGYALVQNATTRVLVQSDFAAPTDNMVTAIKDHNKTDLGFTLFPNPSRSTFTLTTKSTEKASIQIFSVTGSLLISSVSDQQKAEFGGSLSPGIYWIHVTTKTGTNVVKWVKE